MADDTSPQTQKSQKQSTDEPRYAREDLIRDSRARFDVSSYVLEGALSEQQAKTFTISRTEELVKAFLGREEETDTEANS